MLLERFLEQEDRVRSSFGEFFFLLMRKQRYGISNCMECGDGELLGAQLETLLWRKQKAADEEIDALDSES